MAGRWREELEDELRELGEAQPREAQLRARVAAYLARAWRRVLEELARRPGAASCLAWLAIAGIVAFDQAHPIVDVPYTGAFIQFLVAGVVSLFSWIGGHAVTVVVTIAQAAVMIGTAIAHFAIQIGLVVAKVYGLLGRFWTGALRPFVGWAWRQVDRLSAWLNRTMGPVIKFLNEVRKAVDKFYARWLAPIFDTIDYTRRILQLLAQLRVPFARRIDEWLGYLESRLLWPIQQLYYRLNEVMNWVNRIVTLDGYLQRVTMIRSLMRYQVDALKVWWTSIHKALEGSKRDEYERPLQTRNVDQVREDMIAYVRFGGGPDRARIDEHAADLAIRLRRA